MAHIFHMNLETYNANTAFPAVGVNAGVRTAQQTQLNATLLAYSAANGAVDLAGFTEVFIANGHNPLNVRQALNDLAVNLAIPANMGNRHIFGARCGRSALMNSSEVVAIVINGNAVINGAWRVTFDIHQGHGILGTQMSFYVAPMSLDLTYPGMQPVDYRNIVFVDYTLGGVTRRVGFVHNVYVQGVNRAYFMRILRGMIVQGNLTLCGGDFNETANPNVPAGRRRQFFYPPPVATTTGGNTYDWWTTTLNTLTGLGGMGTAPAVTWTAAAPGGATGSDHRGVGLQFL